MAFSGLLGLAKFLVKRSETAHSDPVPAGPAFPAISSFFRFDDGPLPGLT
jgi:hypothetical protein